MDRRIILALAALLILSGGCAPEGTITQIGCGTLVMTCDHAEQIVMRGVKSLSQNMDDHTRYFRFYDCVTEEWLRSSCPATCTLEMR